MTAAVTGTAAISGLVNNATMTGKFTNSTLTAPHTTPIQTFIVTASGSPATDGPEIVTKVTVVSGSMTDTAAAAATSTSAGKISLFGALTREIKAES